MINDHLKKMHNNLDKIFNVSTPELLAAYDLCLNYKIGEGDNVLNHEYDGVNKDGSDRPADIDQTSFQAFLHEYAVMPYFNPYDALTGQDKVDFVHIADQVLIETRKTAEAYEKAMNLPPKAAKSKVDKAWNDMQKAKDKLSGLYDYMEHAVGSRDGEIKTDPMWRVIETLHPQARPCMINAMDEVGDILIELKDKTAEFAKNQAPEPTYHFPELNEEGTIDEIYTNVRNGYYDSNIEALMTFHKLFEETEHEHMARYTKANIGYAEAVAAELREGSAKDLECRFYNFLMDIEEELRIRERGSGLTARCVSMEEYDFDGLTINAMYDVADDKITVYVDEFDDDGLRKSNTSAYTYDEIKDMTADDFKKATNVILFYAQEIEDVERD